MEDRAKYMIEETFHEFLHSSSNRYDFYDLTASIIGWKAISDQGENSFDSVMKNIGAPTHKDSVLFALRRWDKIHSQLLALDDNIVHNFPDHVWINMCEIWVRFFNDSGNSCYSRRETTIAVIDALEDHLPISLSESFHLAPKELIITMVDFFNNKDGQTLYDPFCRSGNLLTGAVENLKGLQQVKGFSPEKLTWKFANLKMVVSEYSFDVIIPMKSLQDSRNDDQTYDCIITNPPFGNNYAVKDIKPFINGDWGDYVEKSNRMDVFFLCHVLSKLSDQGKASIILPSTFLSSHGLIRELMSEIVKRNILDAVVSLPGGIFTSTGVSTVLICLNKQRLKGEKVFVVDAPTFSKRPGKRVVLDQIKLVDLMERVKKREYQSVEKNLIAVTLSQLEETGYDLKIWPYLKNESNQNVLVPSELLYEQCLDLEEKLLMAKQLVLETINSK